MSKPTLEDRLEYLVVLVFVRVMRLLPGRFATWLGGVLGRIAFDLVGFRRGVTVANIRRHLACIPAGPDPVACGRRAYINFGRSIAEFARLPSTDMRHIRANIDMEGLSHLDAALAAGKGAVLVTGHFGSWELMGCALARLGYPLVFVVGVQRNPLVQHVMNALRKECGIPVIEPASLMAATHALRDNRFLAMLSDQDAGRHGIFAEFLGEPASTPPGAARLAALTGAPVITGFIVRTGLIRHRIIIEAPLSVDRSLAKPEVIKALTQAYSASIESYVRRYPDHYLWAHRKWKTRPSPG
jgi:KDO2-lipid IV(A) lauroyltransferase